MDVMAVQFCIQWYWLSTRVYSLECIPLPGPPAEKEPPPPSRYCRTVATTDPLTSFHPPACSNAKTPCVSGPAANCLQSPPMYCDGGSPTMPAGSSPSNGSARRTSSLCSTPAPDRHILAPVYSSLTNSLATSGVRLDTTLFGAISGWPKPPLYAALCKASSSVVCGLSSRFFTSCFILSSASLTSQSSNFGLTTQSVRISRASGTVARVVSMEYAICSLLALAKTFPPMASISRTTLSELRFFVPFHAMYSSR
mmetsp:Transcript_11940/g.33673  ORF Transcript_11940/g.33673 Transcript_11940/m.33673 type:complete len:254 (+) Transcript_11940:2212-2973(+)